MFINEVRLKNGFKRFHDLTIDLGKNPKRIVALVGPNGCGKSSVLDGILHYIAQTQAVGAYNHRDVSYHWWAGREIVNPQDVAVSFVEGDYQAIHQR